MTYVGASELWRAEIQGFLRVKRGKRGEKAKTEERGRARESSEEGSGSPDEFAVIQEHERQGRVGGS